MNVRETVRILLLNKKNELLLICVEDPNIISVDGKKHNRFWFTAGGQIDENETAANTHPHASAIQMPKQNVIIL